MNRLKYIKCVHAEHVSYKNACIHFKTESDAIRFAAQHRIARVVPTPSRPLRPQHAFDGQDVADRMDRGEDVKIGSLTRVKNLALLTILEPALFKNALAEEMESIKMEKTRTADLEALMVESGLADDRNKDQPGFDMRGVAAALQQ